MAKASLIAARQASAIDKQNLALAELAVLIAELIAAVSKLDDKLSAVIGVRAPVSYKAKGKAK